MNPIAILAAAAFAIVGQPAPDLTVKDTKGAEVKLADFKGKTVVLEWTNFGCPFVKKHYDGGNMQKLQETYAGKDVVWLTVASGKSGAAATLAGDAAKAGNKAAHILVDADGKLGKAFGAKVTPHLFIVNKDGKVVYDGAIDDKKSTDKADIATATPTLANALDAVLDGKEPEKATTEPYGCGVKY